MGRQFRASDDVSRLVRFDDRAVVVERD